MASLTLGARPAPVALPSAVGVERGRVQRSDGRPEASRYDLAANCAGILATPVSIVVLSRLARRNRGGQRERALGRLAVAAGAAEAEAEAKTARPSSGDPELDEYLAGWDRSKWEEMRDGKLWLKIKSGAGYEWLPEEQVGTYRMTDWGYESRDKDGKWSASAQPPPDTSHLTQEQLERFVKELKGDSAIKCTQRDHADPNSEDFTPKAQVPPLEKWPFHGLKITDELKATDEQLKGYDPFDYTQELRKAFFLSSRWKLNNEARRHLGYSVNDDIDDIAYLNGCVLALRCLVEQLKRLANWQKGRYAGDEPNDAARLQALKVTGILGTDRGSAMAMWLHNTKSKIAAVDLCIGDMGTEMGPIAEETLLRVIASQAAEMGAETLWCRTRRTESGLVFVPKYMKKMGFELVPAELQEEQDWEVLGAVEEEQETMEAVPGLSLWLSGRKLGRHLADINAWCKEMGALDLNEVVDNLEDIAEYLGDKVTDEEKLVLQRAA